MSKSQANNSENSKKQHILQKSSSQPEVKQAIISSLTLMDDIFIKIVLQDKRCTEYILQVIMEDDSLRLKEQCIQKDIPNVHGHSLVLDCFCEDKEHNLYNIEIQNDPQEAIPKRARFHTSLIDIHSLKKGQNFNQLPKTYVIFITAKDIFKQKLQVYHIERIIKENGQPFDDDSYIIYFNTSKIENDSLGRLAEDFHTNDPKQMHSTILSNRVAELKSTDFMQKGDKNMNILLERYRQAALEEGREEGREEGSEKLAQLMGILAESGRLEDIKKASRDKRYRKKLFRELNLM